MSIGHGRGEIKEILQRHNLQLKTWKRPWRCSIGETLPAPLAIATSIVFRAKALDVNIDGGTEPPRPTAMCSRNTAGADSIGDIRMKARFKENNGLPVSILGC